MKRPILLGTLAIVLVFCYCFWGLAPKEKAAPHGAMAQVVPSSQTRAVIEPALASAPVAMAQVKQQQPVTDDWIRIFDSSDVMKTINDIRRSGNKDEKSGALYLLGACSSELTRHSRAASVAGSEGSEVSAVSENALSAERARAEKLLVERCKGVGDLSVEDRNALKQDLRDGSSFNTSTLGQLNALADNEDDRWNAEQSKLVTDALYSNDPILKRAALNALLHVIDSNAPSGKERDAAFNMAFAHDYLDPPLSEFERLSTCEYMGRCTSNWDAFNPTRPDSPAIRRLAQEYATAFQSHTDAAGILAIR